MKWFKCSESHPKKQGVHALVCSNNKVFEASHWIHKPGEHDEETGWYDISFGDLLIPQPKLWRAMPKPPISQE